ncbi:MAG: polysaccharide pyruvyl transferase family protein [Lachnospiraceae bacterium]|nr:polysaccharide pyruvyl transferase family protein [Lachnospiraceae bacterium]
MKIKTITCHDVYNVGASLQAYALQQYLTDCGHEVEIIDYKPDYLSRQYNLASVDNPKYDVPVIREAYLIAKFPRRLKARRSERKKNFDIFRNDYLRLTRRYNSFSELQRIPPIADVYFAGSDQIWNPLFKNGRDPSFYLAFAPKEKVRASYAASFATDQISDEDKLLMKPLLSGLDAISVREKSALITLNEMGLQGKEVCDPVFLLSPLVWRKIALSQGIDESVFMYDFDDSELIQKVAARVAEDKGTDIVSFFPTRIYAKVADNMGPREFLGAILESDVIVSNSFHATAFAIMFHKEFFVINRKENLNTRMCDLLEKVGLSERLIWSISDLDNVHPIDWKLVDKRLEQQKSVSVAYIADVLKIKK